MLLFLFIILDLLLIIEFLIIVARENIITITRSINKTAFSSNELFILVSNF